METSTFGPITDWNEVIKKEVKGLNDADLLLTNPHYQHQIAEKNQSFKDKTPNVLFLSLRKG